MRIKTGSLLLAAVLVVAASLSAAEARKAGQVLFVRGEAWHVRNGEKSAVAPGSMIRGGDILKTGSSGKVSVRFDNGYVIEIGPRSEFTFDEPGAETERLRTGMLDVGVAYVKHRSRDKRKKRAGDYDYLQVQTPSAVAGVRGTDFAVAVAPDGKGLVAVKEGQVNVSKIGGGGITLNMRQKLEIPAEKAEISEENVSDYFPEQYNVEQWFETARTRALKNVGPVARRLAVSVKNDILKAERLADEIAELTDKITLEARLAEKNRLKGQTIFYKQHKHEVERLFPQLKAGVRAFIRLDNIIRRRGRVLAWLMEQAAEPGSPAPPAAKRLIETHYSAFEKLGSRLNQLRAKRREILREKVPEMKRAARLIL